MSLEEAIIMETNKERFYESKADNEEDLKLSKDYHILARQHREIAGFLFELQSLRPTKEEV